MTKDFLSILYNNIYPNMLIKDKKSILKYLKYIKEEKTNAVINPVIRFFLVKYLSKSNKRIFMGTAQAGNLLGSLLPLIVLFVIFYFLIIRPQQKQQKQHQQMLESLKKGDKIVTNGGLIVEIVNVEPEYFVVKHPDGAKSRLVKSFISSKWED
jgi:preprotein translocase subunit YajC